MNFMKVGLIDCGANSIRLVVYQVKGDETGEYFAATFNPEDGEEGQLSQIETDAEWDLVEEVLENYLEEDEEDEDEEDDDEEEKN